MQGVLARLALRRDSQRSAADPLPRDVERIRLGTRLFYVSRPNVTAYGHLALDVLQTLVLAQRAGASVLFVRDPSAPNGALYDVRLDGVRVVGGRALRALILVLLAWKRHRSLPRPRTALDKELKRRENAGDVPPSVWRDVRRFRSRIRPASFDRRVSYHRRMLIRSPARASLARSTARQAAEELRALGIDEDARVVCVHARERGFKHGRESLENTARNAPISDYGAAIDLLLSRGLTVVRVGDPSMSAVGRADVIDLATSPLRTPLLELACLFRAELLVCGESGPLLVSYLTDTPLLCVNATDVIGSYPVRDSGFLLTKAVVDRTTGTQLRMTDLISDRYVENLRNAAVFSYADNAPEEIRAAVEEALGWLDGKRVETERQRRYRELAGEAAERLAGTNAFAAKWGAEDGFLGDGRVVDFRLEQRW